MKNIIIPLISLLLIFAGTAIAQDDSGGGGNFKPSAGSISAAILFGSSPSYSAIAPNSANNRWNTGANWFIYGNAPTANFASNAASLTSMVGAEGRYFITNEIAVKAGGYGIISNTPPRDNIQGFYQNDIPNAGWIPDYDAVVADNRVSMLINVGGEYHFPISFDRVDAWAGVNIPYYYGRHSQYDPTVWMVGINGTDTGTPSQDDGITVYDVGPRHSEVIGFGGQAVGGVDFYLMEGLFMGFEIKPISYNYSYMMQYPAPGLPALGSDHHAWSFLAQPAFKVGFRIK